MKQHRRGDWNTVVYAAENDVWRQKRNGVRDLMPPEARAFANTILESETWQHGPVEVRFHSKGHGSYAHVHHSERYISLSRLQLHTAIVVHELAHMACPPHEGHGRLFRAAYLELCEEHLPVYAPKLARALAARGVSL